MSDIVKNKDRKNFLAEKPPYSGSAETENRLQFSEAPQRNCETNDRKDRFFVQKRSPDTK